MANVKGLGCLAAMNCAGLDKFSGNSVYAFFPFIASRSEAALENKPATLGELMKEVRAVRDEVRALRG